VGPGLPLVAPVETLAEGIFVTAAAAVTTSAASPAS
jgi:hypothetical protein